MDKNMNKIKNIFQENLNENRYQQVMNTLGNFSNEQWATFLYYYFNDLVDDLPTIIKEQVEDIKMKNWVALIKSLENGKEKDFENLFVYILATIVSVMVTKLVGGDYNDWKDENLI